MVTFYTYQLGHWFSPATEDACNENNFRIKFSNYYIVWHYRVCTDENDLSTNYYEREPMNANGWVPVSFWSTFWHELYIPPAPAENDACNKRRSLEIYHFVRQMRTRRKSFMNVYYTYLLKYSKNNRSKKKDIMQ